MDYCDEIGICIPDILLPKDGTELEKWAVIACDQYTSEPTYWLKVKSLVERSPSTLNMIFPEVYINQPEANSIIDNINAAMKTYLADGTLSLHEKCIVYTERHFEGSQVRKGLVLAVDLEKYSFSNEPDALIRATEHTVIDRLPPRIKVRKAAPLELPHVMLLIDDPDNSVIGLVEKQLENLKKIYDFKLMLTESKIKGFKIDDAFLLSSLIEALKNLITEKQPLLFAVGDGNHSLASAKCHWDEIKGSLPIDEQKTHPGRFALVEVVNIHDPGLSILPIHRVMFNAPDLNLKQLPGVFYTQLNDSSNIEEEVYKLKKANRSSHIIGVATCKEAGIIRIDNPTFCHEAGTIDMIIEKFMLGADGVKVDYIHGKEVVAELTKQPGNIGFYLPPLERNELFKVVCRGEILPKKTFSMGEAEQKRFYLECRKIKL